MYFSHIVGGLGYPCIIVGIWSHNLGANFPSLKDCGKYRLKGEIWVSCNVNVNFFQTGVLSGHCWEECGNHTILLPSASTTLYVCLMWLRSGVELVLAHLYKPTRWGLGHAVSPCRHKLYCFGAKSSFRQKSCTPSYRKWSGMLMGFSNSIYFKGHIKLKHPVKFITSLTSHTSLHLRR